MNTLQTMRKKLTSRKGFTLMEMLIVVAIIVILLAIAVPYLNNALEMAKKTTDDANIKSAYTEFYVYETLLGTDSATEAPTVSGTTITFADKKTTYTLKHYKGVDTTKTPWVGSETAISGGGGGK